MEREASPPQFHGVVIISLPPPDDPSKGKTITAFTYSDSDQLPSRSPPLSLPTTTITTTSSPPRRSLISFSPKKALASVLAVSLVAFSLWVCLASEIPLQLLGGAMEEEEGRSREETRSFLFPLYAKSRGRELREVGDVKLSARGVGVGAEGVKQERVRSKVAVVAAAANSTVVLPIKGNVFPDGQYYTSIFVGNPPRPYFLDVDTGSDLMWIQCDAPCMSCAKGPHPLYSPTKGEIVLPRDSLCQELQGNQNYCDSCHQCDYEIEYADRSSSMGVLARDDMSLLAANGDKEKLSFVFGCAYDQQGQLLASPAKTDGILGLSSAKISLPSQLASQGIISNIVGHCITNEASGGYMFLGDDFVPRWGVTWVPTLTGLASIYRTEIQKASYGGLQLSVGGKGGKTQVIFDSGSSYTYFPDKAYTNLLASLKYINNHLVQDDSDQTLPICWRADFPVRSVSDVQHLFKPLTLHFEKRLWVIPTTFTIPPEGYLTISDKGNICLGVLNGMEIYHGSTIILGDVSFRGKLVVYDNEQKRIGWTDSSCAKPRKANDFPFFF